MKFAVLVCLLALAAMAPNVMPSSDMQPFQKGETYNYRLRTQVSHSLLSENPSVIREQAVTGLQAILKLTFTNERHARVQLQHVKLGEVNGELPQGQDQVNATKSLSTFFFLDGPNWTVREAWTSRGD